MSDEINQRLWIDSRANQNMSIRSLCACLAISTMLALIGCGGPRYPTARLEGRVAIADQPIAHGRITFTPLQSARGAGAAAAIESGRYIVESVPQGRVRVNFQALKETGRTQMQFGKSYPETVNIVPDKYRAGLEIEVDGDKNNQDFSL